MGYSDCAVLLYYLPLYYHIEAYIHGRPNILERIEALSKRR